jgi:hypothetical protein
MLNDPRARRAYVLTKLGVFAAAAIATWPLAQIFGPRAWWGLGAFGVLLAVLTIGVLIAGRAAGEPDAPAEGEEEDEDVEFDPAEAVVLPIQDSIDLHPFAPRDLPQVVSDYLEAAHARGYRELRLIHGRGIGVQRERVRSLLSKHPLVSDFRDAPPERGGWGATLAFLKDEDAGGQ